MFEKIGVKYKWCYECGAADGVYYSNTKRLRDAGWNALLIEGNREQFEHLKGHASATVKTICQQVTPKTFDRILHDNIPGGKCDLGVIDVDSFEYYLVDGIDRVKPRLLLVEYGYYSEPDFVPAYEACNGGNQAGKDATIAIARARGYAPIARTYCNILFGLLSELRGVK